MGNNNGVYKNNEMCNLYQSFYKSQTIENQVQVLRKVAMMKGSSIVHEYSDECFSEAKGRDDITDFDNLIKDATRKKLDMTLT